MCIVFLFNKNGLAISNDNVSQGGQGVNMTFYTKHFTQSLKKESITYKNKSFISYLFVLGTILDLYTTYFNFQKESHTSEIPFDIAMNVSNRLLITSRNA